MKVDRNKNGQFIKNHTHFGRKKTGKYITCQGCNNIIYVIPSKNKKSCSKKCHYQLLSTIFRGRVSPMKGKKYSEEAKKRHSKIAKEKGFGKWMLGKHHTLTTKLKISQIGKDRVAAGLHNNYKGGIERINSALKKSLRYKLWRMTVLKRDNFTCVFCNKKARKLHADHIKQWAFYPELRFIVENGRTLCIPCHRNTGTWGIKLKTILL